MAVRFAEKDATVRYLPGQVGLAEILKRYEDTPFAVSPTGPVVAVAHTKQVTLRGWSKRSEPIGSSTDTEQEESELSQPIEIFVEVSPAEKNRIGATLRLSLAEESSFGLELHGEFAEVKSTDGPASRPGARRFAARATEAVALKPGEITVPIAFHVPTIDANDKPQTAAGTFAIVVRTPQARQAAAQPEGGVALVDGMLDLRLAHLCDQTGCVEHFHKSLEEISGLAAVLPHPSRDDARATVYRRANQPIDVWSLRESLRSHGVEVTGLTPRGLDSLRLRVELPRWRVGAESKEVQWCAVCRARAVTVLQDLPWVDDVEVAGGGINLRPAQSDVELIELLNALTGSGTVPLAVWLVPDGTTMPKSAPPRLVRQDSQPKLGGSNAHSVVEFQFAHTCDVGTDLLTMLGETAWASRTHLELAGETTTARAAIGDRKFANITTLLAELRSAGHLPSQIRLAEFGDVRVQLEFAHICGPVEFSQPPKKKAQSKPAAANTSPSGDVQPAPQPADSKGAPNSNPASDGAQSKPKKPFVPKPIRPAKSSPGRQAIEAALARVTGISEAIFHDYHTKPAFDGPRKLTIAFQTQGPDVVRLDELIGELRVAGFPPQSVLVSRRFPGIPFGKQLPSDLLVTGRNGNRHPLSTLGQSGRPLAVAFVSLNCKRYQKYQPDPQYYQQLAQTVDRYQDRVGFVAVSANPDDEFPRVAEFWDQTGLSFPLLHDADGTVRSVFNAQATPPPHLFVFDAEGRLRYAGDPHDSWEKPEDRKDDFLDRALERVLAGKYEANGAVFFNKSVCNCSDPNCKCPKCGCGSTCRCTIKH